MNDGVLQRLAEHALRVRQQHDYRCITQPDDPFVMMFKDDVMYSGPEWNGKLAASLAAAGFHAKLVEGLVKKIKHAWVEVSADDKVYWIDITMDQFKRSGHFLAIIVAEPGYDWEQRGYKANK